jgi:hypothetical protein
MGLRPTQGDEKRVFFDRASVVEGPAVDLDWRTIHPLGGENETEELLASGF